MKTKPHVFAAFLLVVISFITACNKESDCKSEITHYASSQLKSNTEPIHPLTGRDTLKFLYNNKDTQIYVGQGVQSNWILKGGGPRECVNKYEYLIYNYNCINADGFSFGLYYYPYQASVEVGLQLSARLYFKNVYVGDYLISTSLNDSIEINKHWYKEPYYISNGPDTFQYFMLSSKSVGAYFLKIKYLNNELTLLR